MRQLKAFLKGIAILAALLLVVVSAAWFFIGRDSAPPADGDLQLAPRNIPSGENGFHDIDLAKEAVYCPEAIEDLIAVFERETAALLGESFEEEEPFDSGGDGVLQEWDEAVVREILEKNASNFEKLERSLQCKDFLVPPAKDNAMDMDFSYLTGWRRLAEAAHFRAVALFRQGEEAEAFNESMKLIRMGWRIQGARGALITGLIGHSVGLLGLDLLEKFLGRTTLEAAELRKYLAELKALEIDSRMLSDILKAEYEYCSYFIRLYNELPSDILSQDDLYQEEWFLFRFSFKPQRTRGLVADAVRVVLGNVSLPYKDWKPLPAAQENIFNRGGKVIYDMVIPSFEVTLKKLALGQPFQMRSHRVLLALKCHNLENGSLPEKLEALVPGYLEAVPVDPYDGRPLRYSREKRIIYSIGEDLVDDGGSIEEESSDSTNDNDDPTLRIRFGQ